MPIILKSEKRQPRTRIVHIVLYTMLALGAVTMVYPFLLMTSGSFKSKVDVQDLSIIPKYFYKDEVLFKKYVEAKYNESIAEYSSATGDEVQNFRAVKIPKKVNDIILSDWRDFVKISNMPASWYLTGFGPTADGKIIQKNERAYREFIRDLCSNDLDVFRTRFDEPIESWFFLKFPAERLYDRKYQLSDTPLIAAFYQFKLELPLSDRIYISCENIYKNYLRLIGENSESATLKARSIDPIWGDFVRNFLHPQFVAPNSELLPSWATFLEQKYVRIQNLNKLYDSDYVSFLSVPFPKDRITSSAQLTDYMLYISDPVACPIAGLSLITPELLWREYLNTKYGTIDDLSSAYGINYSNFDQIYIPQLNLDLEYIQSNSGLLRREFATNNYLMVMEYILFYGNGIYNTFIYCLASIVLALLVNPLAAYALSRYQLPGQFKILLFLIATMAFPGVVTMIPNFLLLRDLGLLNTFAALLLPTMANGYSIFLLKGFFDSLPQELFEAAEIDGASEWQKFWMITMNLSKPILAVVALGAFTAAYSNFMYAFILCQDKDMWTLTVWLYQLQQFSSQGVVYASLMIAAVPTLIIFVLCQNVIIKGIVVPTEK